MNEQVSREVKLMVSTEKGVRSMVKAIEKEVDSAYVPALPWAALAPVLRFAPLGLVKKLS
jgi:hypothetical protein